MPLEVIMPALGMAQTTGLIVAWHKSAGDAVAAGDVLFEVETDKATMEVEAQGAGFLTDITAEAGQDVPVGQVIAHISETAVSSAPVSAPTTAPVADAGLPQGASVIMPTLGMAQDTGLLVRWLKTPGDAVAADDILFEVETDKSTVEVNAGHDGYVAAHLALAGEDVPVGQTIAVISTEKPAKPISRSSLSAASVQAAPAQKADIPLAPVPERKKTAALPTPPEGRILASPKARRLALERGLDLARLVVAGVSQPYHAKDLDTLAALPVATPQVSGGAARHLTAEVPKDGFGAFADWAAKAVGISDSDALLASLAAASLGRGTATIGVQAFDRDRLFTTDGNIATVQLAPDQQPDLILRDLRLARIVSIALGAEDQPVLTLTASGAGLTITLECAADHLTAPQAITLLSEFAGRMEQPLRHLL